MQQNVTFRQISLALINWTRRSIGAGGLALACALASPADLQAQGLFSPAITVNEDVITSYELEQRALFLSVLGSVQGDPLETARNDLIEDRLKRQVMNEVGLILSEEEVTEGMRELAQRTNLSLEEFLASLSQAGVARETVRDFTTAGIGWREYVRGRFLSQARPSEAEIDRAMGTAGSGSVQVLLSEIILPLTQENAAQVQDLALQISELTKAEAFAASAAQFSAADSRTDGGRLPWVPLSRLPPQLQEVVLGLETGQITQPLPMQGAIAIFRMRGLREVDGRSASYAAIDYATYRIPGGRSPEALERAAKLRDEVDTCDDLFGFNKGQNPDLLFRGSQTPNEIPQDIALELARFDENESSATLTRDNGQTLLFVMLCGRTSELVASQENARASVANALVQQRLNELAEAHVEQLRANARIEIQ